MWFVLSSHSVVCDLMRDYSIDFVSSKTSPTAAQLSMETISLGLKTTPNLCVYVLCECGICIWWCVHTCVCMQRPEEKAVCVLLHHALPYSLETMNLELGCHPASLWVPVKCLTTLSF